MRSKIRRSVLWSMTMAAMVVLVSCTPLSRAQQEPDLQFRVALEVDADQQFHVRLGVHNGGRGQFEGDSRFNADMEVRRLPDEELRASAHVVPLQPVAPAETVWPLDWRGQLDAGTYRLTWGAEGYGQTAETFTIVEKDGQLYYRGQPLASSEPTESPVDDQETLVARAISDLSKRLDIDPEEVTVTDVESVEFPDASLGVPEPGKTYAQVMVPGLIVRLQVGDEIYVYHAAGERVVAVPMETEGGGEGAAEESVASHHSVTLPDVGLSFEVPLDWVRLETGWAWTPELGSEMRVGAKATGLEPPMEPEAALLPKNAQILAAEAVDLGWARGRLFELEVFEAAAEGDGPAPVESVQTHVLVVVRQGEERVGLDFYASARDADALEELQPVLDHVVATATLRETEGSSSLPLDDGKTQNWQVFQDEVYGFRLRIPRDWTYKEMAARGSGVPDDWPLERSVIFFPEAWAERFEDTGRPPDPGDPPAVPAVSLEVYVGPTEQFRRALPEPALSEPFEIDGISAVREVDVLGDTMTLMRYVFQAPDDGQVRVVLVDNFSGFAERRHSHPEVPDLIPLVVTKFEWSR